VAETISNKKSSSDVILGIETSCDETAAAVWSGSSIKSNIIASQIEHGAFGGIVPELASRAHQQAIVPLVDNAMKVAGAALEQLTGIAVTIGPGLMGSLLVGTSFAQSLALSLEIPLIGVNHLEAHLWSVQIEHPACFPPFIALIISGGNTILVKVDDFQEYHILGQTRDDAAGEAFDKVAQLLGLGYPGGAKVDMYARKGNPGYHRFPKPGPKGKTFDFSFSGIKTAVLYFLQSISEKEQKAHLADICASFQKAVIQSLVDKTCRALEETGIQKLVVAGGVAVNSGLREAVKQRSQYMNFQYFIPSPIICTDNAAMVALLGSMYLSKGITSEVGLQPVANLSL